MKFPTNPLPGMNPWLEAYWGDIHTSMTTYARDAIQNQLPGDLQARVEEYLSVLEPSEEFHAARRISPDVHVVEQPGMATSTVGGVALEELIAEEPIRIRRHSPPQTLRYIHIVDLKAGRRVVTAIEFISLANKASVAGCRQYLAKQNEFLNAGVNLVEIDLLRDGHWVLAAHRENYPSSLTAPYRVCVVRGETPDEAEVYQATFTAPLPTIRIPLRPNDEDVLLPLQALVDQAYENGRYGNDLDYSQTPHPPLEDHEQAWIAEYLAKKASGNGK